MSKNVRANIELGINIVVAIAIVVVASAVVKRYAFSSNPANPPASLKGIGWRCRTSTGNRTKKLLSSF